MVFQAGTDLTYPYILSDRKQRCVGRFGDPDDDRGISEKLGLDSINEPE